MRSTRPLVLLASLAAVGGAACSGSAAQTGDAAANRPQIELTQGDGCGESFFWATDDEQRVAVIVGLDTRGRADDAIEFEVGDPGIQVQILRGEDLARNMCTDVIDGNAEPTSTTDATTGTGLIELEPHAPGEGRSPCGTAVGALRLTGVTTEDGSHRFAPITVETDAIGCYAG